MNLSGYQLNAELYNGLRTIVYRGERQADSLPVAIKLLKNPYPTFNELVQFRNQYTIAKNLQSPLIIQTYSLETYQNGYALVMEDFEGISLKDYFSKNHGIASLEEFLVIAIALCETLDLLYHERIIHKDIKPSNILINPETKQIKLIDFSIASLLPRETQTLVNPNVLEGTLAYISPEQTGRMNRGIDYRTDFYSLGVTFYELLTGELPFQSDDAMELIHAHLAKIPPLLHEINPDIPSVISKIMSKLMSKNAEDRYQSALGLKYDLEQCLTQLRETGEIRDFEIASRDLCDRFIIPDKLYGRETEVNTLLEAFERVSLGATEMMLVAGFSGIGKTAVVNEVHKPIVRQHGYFIKGKFDQFNRNIPFSAFVQAFRDLMGQLLTENDAQVQEYQRHILAAVGENGQVIIEVIPELERIIGQQPPAIELSGHAAQNRFNLLFQKFVRVFTTKEHPLVIFLDDLQWADSASLNLIQLLINESDNEYLLLIGAYRDNETSAAHPLMLTLAEIIKYQGIINTITLAPLSNFSLNLLVAETLKCSLIVSQPLTQLVYQKTQGNPFFSTQFLKALHEDGLITFDWDGSNWQCDISAVKALAISDDVVEFMAVQLQKLPPATQNILQIAACIGNEFDLKTLALVCQESIIETATCLWNALHSGLILPQTEIYKFFVGTENPSVNQDHGEIFAYKFLHDRVQQAAYSLIPEDQKQTTHIKIGRLLWSNTPEAEIEEQVFAIANQLNIGLEQFHQPQERHQLSRLNFIAGKKAKVSTAYQAALAYLKISIELLPIKPWQSDYDFTLSLYNEATEASYLSGEMDLMENFAQEVLQQAKAIIDTAKIYEVKIEAYAIQSKFLAAIDTAMQFLRPIGIEFPSEPTDQDFFLGLQEIQALLSDKKVAELADLPEMQQPELRAALRVLVKVDTPAYLGKPELHRLLVLKELPICFKYGNTSASAFIYSGYGLMLSGQSNSILQGYEFGQLALQLLSKFSDREYEARVLVVVHGFITHWQEPLTATLKPLLRAYASGLEIGDLTFACHGASVYCYHAYVAGQELTTLANDLGMYSAALAKIHKQATLNYHNIYHQIVLNLIETTDKPWELVGTAYDEKSMLLLNGQASDPNSLWHFCVNKLILCYLFQVLDLAVEYAIKAKQCQSSGLGYGMTNIPLLNWYDSLVQLALYPTASPTEQQQILQQVAENQQIMEQWANYGPMNQLHRFYLVEAEKHQVLGDKTAAIEFYDRAISQAKANGYIQEEALANELAAKFYLNWEKEKVAAVYMQEAYYCYSRWGAKAKVADLEKRYPQLLAPILKQNRSVLSTNETIFTLETVTSTNSATSSSTNISDTLDLTAILTASQTISGEIELDKLLSSLLSIVIENAGADKCVLMLWQDNDLLIQGAITQDSEPIMLQNLPIADSQDIPHKLIYKVKHSQQTIVLLDATADITFANDPYIIRQQPKSILCSPILNQGKLLGILYLENNLTRGAFTSDRITILNFLCTQSAISLENARLYELEQQKSQELEQALHDLQKAQLQIIQGEKMSALGNLVAGVAHEINNPVGFLSGNIKPALDYINDLFGLINLVQEKHPQLHPEVQEEIEAIDLEYIREDLPKLVGSMREGVKRIADISTSLRTFSRADTNHPVACNIHDGIDSTIMILKHRLKANETRPEIQVIKEYGNLPQIECYAGQLNQVFMNLLSNAIDALEESNQGCKYAEISNEIRIKTELSEDKNQAIIRIKDNGIGITAEVQSKIFDHLFTTKGVGKGTGLGLAIAHQIIIEKHQGTIEVESTIGCGTEFSIRLPILSSQDY